MMPAVVSILFGAAFTVAVSMALGTLLIRALRLEFYRQEERALAFVAGSACLSLLVFVLATLRFARAGVFLGLGAAIIAVAVFRGAHRPRGDSLPPLGRLWSLLFWTGFVLFGVVYLATAMAPEVSPDGSAYHLGLVSKYARDHGFVRITTSIYAYLSQGAELLFLHAFVFGKHSAAAMVHLAFLIALPLLMQFYGRRFRFPAAGAAGALFLFLSPVVGVDGASAYVDVALACILFALFYVLQIWDQERSPGLLPLAGLLAGFAYAVKYTGFLALPYALGFVGWKLLRKRERMAARLAIIAGCAFVSIAPWMLKNWIWVDNPLAPFYNKVFRNRYVRVEFEKDYRAQLANWGELKSKWEIPLEATVRGMKLQGLLGPLFLIAPVALLSLRYRAGRQLLLAAALFTLTYPANIGTRFLIPPLPFLSIAMALAVANWRGAAVLLVLFHGLSCWHKFLETYCHPWAMRISFVPVRHALRIKPEEEFLRWRLGDGYRAAQMIDRLVPAESLVFAFSPPPEAYTSRRILIGYQGALNNILSDTLLMPTAPHWQPAEQLTFRFEPREARRIRLVQTVRDAPDWSVSELRIFGEKEEIPRQPHWRLRAWPNPWEVQWAFDNNPITRWRSCERTVPGMYLEVDLGRPERIARVVLSRTPNQHQVKLRLEARTGSEPWAALSDEPEHGAASMPSNLRRLATSELKWNGVEYLLIWDNDFVAQDMRANPGLWGIAEVASAGEARLYRIE